MHVWGLLKSRTREKGRRKVPPLLTGTKKNRPPEMAACFVDRER
jgi:hypothetical protein